MSSSTALAPALEDIKIHIERCQSSIPLAPEVDLWAIVDKIDCEFFLYILVVDHTSRLEKLVKLIKVSDINIPESELKNFNGIIKGKFAHTSKLSLLTKLLSKGLELSIETDIRADGWEEMVFFGKVYDTEFKTEPLDVNDFGEIFFEHV